MCDRKTSKLKLNTRAGTGASLEALSVACTTCNSERDLRDIMVTDSLARIGQKCHGRQPWQPRDEEIPCDASLHVLQRSQTAVHFGVTRSALDIRWLEDETVNRGSFIERVVQEYLTTGFSPEELLPRCSKLAEKITRHLQTDHPVEPNVTAQEVDEYLRNLMTRPGDIEDESAVEEEMDESHILLEEWPVLTTPTPSRDPRSPILVRAQSSRGMHRHPEIARLIAAVYLVDRLREVRAFTGFRRVRTDGQLVHPNLGPQKPTWLPATEVFGEGIFVEMSMDQINAWETSNRRGLMRRYDPMREQVESDGFHAEGMADQMGRLPRFILAHTLSHLLIRQLCFECGYSGASLRERLYVFEDRVGFLVYTADGDSEGSLGGLVRQGSMDRFEGTLLESLERARWCSNDPICREMPPHGPSKTNRAACHACTLVSETSCTHLNAFLDRKALVGDGADDIRGYFQTLMS